MPPRRAKLLLALIFLAAAALRFYRIAAQSLWSDEGSSVAQALRDLPAIAANAALDIHPPLYYILLHFWVIPFGTSEAAVRALSALLGVALVALSYLLGREISGWRAGVVAALLAAFNPFQVYYAQEARMYMLMTVLGAVCVYAVLRALSALRPSSAPDPAAAAPAQFRPPVPWGWYLIYAVAAIMGLYTHYFFPIVLIVANAIFFLRVIVARPEPVSSSLRASVRNIAAWVAVQALVVLTFLPWLPTAVRQISTWPAGAQTFSAAEAPLVILRTLAEGLSAPRGDGVWLALFALLLLAGLLPLRGRPSGGAAAPAAGAAVRAGYATGAPLQSTMLLIYLLAPFAVMFALALFKDSFLKFMLVASPPFTLLAARGIIVISNEIGSSIGRVRTVRGTSILFPALFVLALSLPSLASLQNYFFDARFARDDYRGIAAVVTALGRPGDAAILDAPGQQEIFSYYYKGALPVYALPRQRPIDPAATEAELAELLARHTRLFVVFWATAESDPQQVVEAWLNTHAFKADDSWYGNVRLAIYAVAHGSPGIAHPLNVRWGDAITLQGYTLDDAQPSAGDVLPLTLFWHADRAVAGNYKVFVHLLDPRGFVVAQRDAEPVGGSRPTRSWQPGDSLADPYGLFIPAAAPPLSYTIEVGLYDPNTGERLRSPDGADHLVLDTVQVRAAQAVRSIPGMLPLGFVASNGLSLAGYRLDKLGAEGQRADVFHPSDALHLVLFWQSKGAAPGDGTYRLQLGPFVRDTTPTDGLFPLSQWQAGDLVRDDQIIPLPEDWLPGVYSLQIDGRTLVDVEVR